MSWQLRLLTLWLRRVEKPALARIEPAVARARFERQGHMFRNPPYALYLQDRVGDVPITWASCRVRRPGILLYLHGGAHLMGSPFTHRAMLARLSAMTGQRACLPAMRLAPEHPFPASLDDAEAVWEGLVVRGYPPGRIILGGDSSGGGLMLALLARLLARGVRPAAAFALSPWVDLTASGRSMRENAVSDPLLPASRLAEVRRYYLAGADPRDPGASPLFAAFPGCPPVFLQAARTEILRDDSLRMAARLRGFGAAVTVDMWDDPPHVWPIFQGWLPEADAALANIAGFLTSLSATPAES
ncbi:MULTISPECIES: alpha/beta hydrolase fold domain-containing protein [Actibacterium]|uniref:Acetyl esterase/lipase n=1 Tax=Actibacterium naphthalenivorans TaxID=1614693 RepID=A0A840C6S6_9RHOB|nr:MULTISPECIES: alpha/beta hydrolase fold domain-containing protein [Actibacterium]ALG89268.1 hypothetical protein TQ29_02625 [Actibacterium sp. EMB200-NS6]MBB4021135.1 acetyl esterase/lipase [Actibacterium naphthalenivorans]